jgi:hypothetical protein
MIDGLWMVDLDAVWMDGWRAAGWIAAASEMEA